MVHGRLLVVEPQHCPGERRKGAEAFAPDQKRTPCTLPNTPVMIVSTASSSTRLLGVRYR